MTEQSHHYAGEGARMPFFQNLVLYGKHQVVQQFFVQSTHRIKVFSASHIAIRKQNFHIWYTSNIKNCFEPSIARSTHDGFTFDGFNCDGFTCDGFNCDGFNCDGLTCDGFTCVGFTHDGFTCVVPASTVR